MKITAPVVRYFGSKYRLWGWLSQFFAEHEIYTEVFGGAGGALLQKKRSRSEVYNEIDGEVVNYFRVLRDPSDRARLIEAVALTPYARDEFDLAWEPTEDSIERARRLAIRAMMGFGSAVAVRGSTGFRVDTKRAYATAQMDWARYPDAIAAAGMRLQGVLIENRPAVDVLPQHDTSATLHFVDPPYVHATRVIRAQGGYRHEMTDADHEQLLQVLRGLQGMVIVCGYPNDLYRDLLPDWTTHSTKARISAGRGTTMRTEMVWINPQLVDALDRGRGDLFSWVAA